MSMTDPIADMLTRIRNACLSKHRRVDMPLSKMKVEVARILKENNFVQDYRVVETEEGRKVLRVILKYAAGGTPVIRELHRVLVIIDHRAFFSDPDEQSIPRVRVGNRICKLRS